MTSETQTDITCTSQVYQTALLKKATGFDSPNKSL